MYCSIAFGPQSKPRNAHHQAEQLCSYCEIDRDAPARRRLSRSTTKCCDALKAERRCHNGRQCERGTTMMYQLHFKQKICGCLIWSPTPRRTCFLPLITSTREPNGWRQAEMTAPVSGLEALLAGLLDCSSTNLCFQDGTGLRAVKAVRLLMILYNSGSIRW